MNSALKFTKVLPASFDFLMFSLQSKCAKGGKCWYVTEINHSLYIPLLMNRVLSIKINKCTNKMKAHTFCMKIRYIITRCMLSLTKRRKRNGMSMVFYLSPCHQFIHWKICPATGEIIQQVRFLPCLQLTSVQFPPFGHLGPAGVILDPRARNKPWASQIVTQRFIFNSRFYKIIDTDHCVSFWYIILMAW